MIDIINCMKNITICEPKITIMSTLNEENTVKLEELANEMLNNCEK